ncbi:MAG: hypothetical protein AB7F50_06630 [Fimbriimonadaceae bacterium]
MGDAGQFLNRLIVEFRGSGRHIVSMVEHGYVMPSQHVKPGTDPFTRLAPATV